MSNTILTAGAPAARTRPDFTHVSDVMLYDIARHTASLLTSILLGRQRAATDDADREHWVARERLVMQQVRALDPDDRAGLIAQNEAWEDEASALRDGQ
ncbi:hypothetical protein [Propionicicella superfundia]|uniref:hypothetical protein n=1 Tax=Propionicicella superfundia TaxID=348582 RepID=UPI00048E86F7|nr:hypothetical protein [Propionicicella superfundia]